MLPILSKLLSSLEPHRRGLRRLCLVKVEKVVQNLGAVVPFRRWWDFFIFNLPVDFGNENVNAGVSVGQVLDYFFLCLGAVVPPVRCMLEGRCDADTC